MRRINRSHRRPTISTIWVLIRQAAPVHTACKRLLTLFQGLPKLPVAKTPLEATKNGLSFFSKLQGPSGQWASECAGPMFLLPTVVVAWYTTNTPIPPEYAIELKRYLFARQNPDGGWGWHVEGSSGNVGTTLSYVSLRLLGAESDDPRIVKARDFLHSLGGAVYGPSLSKFLLSVLGVMKWDCVNPLLPEFWYASQPILCFPLTDKTSGCFQKMILLPLGSGLLLLVPTT